MRIDSLIFDLDGTLWDSSDNVAASWNEALKPYNITLSKENMKSAMGLPMDKLAAKLFPTLNEDEQKNVLEVCMNYENEYISVHGGKLFADEKRVLEILKKNYMLYIVSNCQNGYIEAFLKYSGFAECFSDFMCWGDTHKPKSYTITELIKKNQCSSAVYIGDTQGDCDAALEAKIPFVFAAYGFGKIAPNSKAGAIVNSFAELEKLFE